MGKKPPGKNAFKFTKTHSLVTFVQDDINEDSTENSKGKKDVRTVSTKGAFISFNLLSSDNRRNILLHIHL